jgi:hypothetical protein
VTAEERAMPVFFHLNHHIKEVLVKAKDFAKRNDKNNTNRSGGNNKDNNNNSGNSRQVPKGLELAASATDASTEQKGKLRMIDNMSFNKDVTRSDMLGYKTKKGHTVLYTATKEACKRCSTKDNKHETPYCFTQKCKRCGLYGHTDHQCKQIVTEANSAEIDQSADEIPA